MKRKLRSIIITAVTLMAFTTSIFAEVLQEITVKEGDTLWSVANFFLKDPRKWPELLRYNKLPSSDLNVILPGMRLKVPILLIKENLRAAHLVYLINDVRYRRNAQAEWKQAFVDMELYNEDGLHTLGASKAKVKFPSGELLQMDENSLIILKPEKAREEVDLLSGGVRASKTRVLTSASIVGPRIEPKGPAPDFRTKVKEDKSTLVEVYEGIVDVTAQGRTVTLTKGFGTEVKFRMAPSLPTKLPPRPDIDADLPADMPGTGIKGTGKVTQGALQLNIKVPDGAAAGPASSSSSSPSNTGSTTAASASSGAPEDQGQKQNSPSKVIGQMVTKYHIQVSTSYACTFPVIDEINPIKDSINVDFSSKKLPDGVYYYRVAYMDDLGFEGQYSIPVQFIIDTVPPVISITSPRNEEEIDTEFIHIEGSTEPNSVLKINDKEIEIDDTGNFFTALLSREGKNGIHLDAKDRAGNRSQLNLTVYKVQQIVKKREAEQKTAASSKKKPLTLASIALGALTGIVIIGVLVLIVH